MSPSVSVRLLLSQSDERLVGYARAGHERAFEALVQRYRRQLLAYCRRLLLSEQRAEDALQQGLLQAWVALRNGSEVSEPRAWLYRIVHNAAVQMLRVSRYDYCQLSESLSGADAPQADLDRRVAVREALAGLAALPEMQREALLRTAVEGDTHRQVAADLGLSEPALRGLVYRARASMRAAAGAIVPPPLIGWALEAGARGTPVLERLAGVGAATGGGSAGLAGLLLKGSAVAITAGALAGGIVASHAHHTANAHEQLLAGKSGGPREGRQQAGDGVARPVAFTRPDTVKAGHPAWHTSGIAASPAKGGPASLGAAGVRTGEGRSQRKPATAPAPSLSAPPAGYPHRGDSGFEPASGSTGGHDGGGGGSQQGGSTGEHDEQSSGTGGHDGSGGESGGTSTDQSGQSSGTSGGDGSGSGGKDSSGGGGGSGEWQSSGATGASGYKDGTPTAESQPLQGG